jgi:hypothetical protein
MLGDAPVGVSAVKSCGNAGCVAPTSVRLVTGTGFSDVPFHNTTDAVPAVAPVALKRCDTGEHAAVGGAGHEKQEEHTSVTGATGKLGIATALPPKGVRVVLSVMEAPVLSAGKPVRLISPSLPMTPQRRPVAVENMKGVTSAGRL